MAAHRSPRVFISYSHDSPAHKDWVRKLAEDLRGGGIDAVLDQWDLRPGADVVAFMDSGIRSADRVLMVCTANYVAKAEERKGGTGYEGMIVTGHVARDTATEKFIPLVRDNPSDRQVPDFLGVRLWLDFRDDGSYEQRLEDLLRTLHAVPRYTKPPIGDNPFLRGPGTHPPAVQQPAEPTPEPQAESGIQASPAERAGPAAPGEVPTPLERFTATTCTLQREGSVWQLRRRSVEVEGYREELVQGVALTMVRIQAGSFLMGSPESEMGRNEREGPQHEVRLREFFMSQTPITQAQWKVVAGWQKVERDLNADPSSFKGGDRPVDTVRWLDAMEFCRRLSERTRRTYTLPSEAQWEYACRAGTSTPFHFGETITTDLANYDGNYTYGDGPKGAFRKQTTPVGSFSANAWGLQDMHGNVWEWCADHRHANDHFAPDDDLPSLIPMAADNEGRLLPGLRGGSWCDDPRQCRSAVRARMVLSRDGGIAGFRVVCLPQGPA